MISKKLTALLAAALLLTGCTSSREAGWENTLPSAVTTEAEKTVMVIEGETNPPISISVPETTTTTEKNTELATSTSVPTLSALETPSERTSRQTRQTSETTTSATISRTESSPLTTTGTTLPTVSTTDPGTSSGSSAVTTQTAAAAPVIREDGEYVFEKRPPIERAYHYYTLDDNKKAAYDIIIEGIKNHSKSFRIPSDISITGDDYVELYQLIYDFEYSIFDLGINIRYSSSASKGNVVVAEASYIYTAEQVAQMQKEIDAAADKILAEIKDGMSEYEIVKLFYDKLAAEIEYNENSENLRDIYGALVTKSTVCGGYAKAFSYLCSKIGIESLTITGDFNSTPHMWNMVKIDGEWYHVDVTSGHSDNAEMPYIRYDYFCVTDDVMMKNHTVYDQPFDYPKATSEKYNYYIYNNLVADDIQSAASLIADEIIKASETKSCAVQFMCSDDEAYSEISNYLFGPTERHAIDIYENTYDSAVNKYSSSSIQYYNDPGTRIIKLFLKYEE